MNTFPRISEFMFSHLLASTATESQKSYEWSELVSKNGPILVVSHVKTDAIDVNITDTGVMNFSQHVVDALPDSVDKMIGEFNKHVDKIKESTSYIVVLPRMESPDFFSTIRKSLTDGYQRFTLICDYPTYKRMFYDPHGKSELGKEFGHRVYQLSTLKSPLSLVHWLSGGDPLLVQALKSFVFDGGYEELRIAAHRVADALLFDTDSLLDIKLNRRLREALGAQAPESTTGDTAEIRLLLDEAYDLLFSLLPGCFDPAQQSSAQYCFDVARQMSWCTFEQHYSEAMKALIANDILAWQDRGNGMRYYLRSPLLAYALMRMHNDRHGWLPEGEQMREIANAGHETSTQAGQNDSTPLDRYLNRCLEVSKQADLDVLDLALYPPLYAGEASFDWSSGCSWWTLK